ncbi:hypothetical protein C1645_846424 [Glomus cerebriforme]|uniref:Crinkler effector protein N-terminal domain-containing protein n=1 Tax=Glomus cerebriforme TaxID=658196 RepID=A0A397T434_9GLOM|nr:hypothetical protein C1645_846424 [Glomus cerebriforme]
MPKYKKSKFGTFTFTMVDISLNCQLFQDVEENYKFTMVANTTYSIKNFKKKIKEKIKEVGNDILNDIETDHLNLWQVWISDSNKDEFSNLTLEMKNKNIKKLEGFIGDYWAVQPLKNFTHIIIDSLYLMISNQEKEKAENLGKRKILPVLNPARSKLFDKIIDEFWEKFKNVSFTSVCESLVDDKEAIVAFIDPEIPDHLPAKFKGFPVFICYEALELHHCSFHKELIPEISISDGNLNLPPNASTLEVLFQNTAEINKSTVKYGVGKESDGVTQPETLDKVNTSLCAKVTKYNFIRANGDCQEIPKIPNVPIGINIQIQSIKTSISNKGNFLYVKKVGRTTYLTEGLIKDKLVQFRPPNH